MQQAPAPTKIVKASWYGPGMEGHRTASGEVYRPTRMTAASKTLPIGSLVKVTNASNGRSVIVKVNDRGPHVRGRSLDLSAAAARHIGLTHKGVGDVKVTVLPSKQNGGTENQSGPTQNAGSSPDLGNS